MSLTIAAEAPPLTVLENGAIRVTGTRMPLEVLIESHVNWGWSPEKLAEEYDGLSLPDIYAVLTYYYRHRVEVEAYMQQQDERAAILEQKFIALRGPHLTRRVMLKRRAFRAGESVPEGATWRLRGGTTEVTLDRGSRFPESPDGAEVAWEFVDYSPPLPPS